MLTRFTTRPESPVRQRESDFWIARLLRLLELNPPASATFDAPKLLHRAIYSTYLDCRAAGFDHEAQLVMEGLAGRET